MSAIKKKRRGKLINYSNLRIDIPVEGILIYLFFYRRNSGIKDSNYLMILIGEGRRAVFNWVQSTLSSPKSKI